MKKIFVKIFLTVFIKIVTKTVFENRYKAKLAFKKIHFQVIILICAKKLLNLYSKLKKLSKIFKAL